eukprot:snap_masked-scaffold_50-processed-gene-0.18-mRNA-1 protein AED:1.00 eAED:1.00 QI:0/0/0/0/1/1/2/0/439
MSRPCVNDFYYRMTPSFAQFCSWFLVGSSTLVIGSLLGWLRNYHHPHLRHRNFIFAFIISTGIFLFISVSNLYKSHILDIVDSNYTEYKLIYNCEIQTFNYKSMIALPTMAQAVRLFLWHRKAAYNRKLAAYFETVSFESLKLEEEEDGTVADPEKRKLLNLRDNYSTSSARNKLLLKCVLPVLLYGLIFAYVSCPSSGRCLYDPGKYPLLSLGGFISNAIFFLFFLVCLYKAYRTIIKYPDPFGVIKEIIRESCFSVLGVTVYMFFQFTDILDIYNPEKDYYFSYLTIVEVALLMTVTYPVIVSYFRQETYYSGRLGLKEVLEKDIGLKVFKEHLIYEFAVEDLLFYEDVVRWQKVNTKFDSEECKAQAKEIFKSWLQEEAFAGIEVTKITLLKVERKLEEGDVSRTLFDECIEEVLHRLEISSFPRFQQSKLYEGLL